MAKRKSPETPEQIERRKQLQREAARRFREKHKERALQGVRDWRDRNRDYAKQWRKDNPLRNMFLASRHRAKRRGIEFTIEFEDLPPIGDFCPILGLPFSKEMDHWPSIDRIDSSKGYVKGNVWIISYRANRIKNDGTAEEHELVAKAMREKMG